MTPEQLAKSGSEDGAQLALFCWAALNVGKYPKLKYLYHCPNGGSRDIREAAKLRAMGVKPGVPDICLPVAFRYGYLGLYIELKRPGDASKKAGKLSDEQQDWISFLNSQGYLAIVCYGWEDARDRIIDYLSRTNS